LDDRLDDRHKIKIGEPGYLLAAAEHGCQVVVSTAKIFKVRDHNFYYPVSITVVD